MDVSGNNFCDIIQHFYFNFQFFYLKLGFTALTEKMSSSLGRAGAEEVNIHMIVILNFQKFGRGVVCDEDKVDLGV